MRHAIPMLPTPRALALLLALATIAAGCTSTPPPADQRATVEFTNLPSSATSGTVLELLFQVVGTTQQVTHADIHHGAAQPGPTALGTEAAATLEGGTTYRAKVPVGAAPGTLHVRAHATAGGVDLWSAPATISILAAAPTGPRFLDVQVPTQAEAGAPMPLRYRLDGQGSTNHVGAHFSQQSSASLPANFPAGTWPGQRASQHLGAPVEVALPATIAVNATFPTPGTWYLRPHVLLGEQHYWGEEVRITVGNPQQPNIVVLNGTGTAVAGEPWPITFALNAQPGTSPHVGAHFSNVSSAGMPANFPAANWSGLRTAPHHGTDSPVNVPGVFTTNLTFPTPGTWYVRAHASVTGQANVWAPELTVQVQAPAAPRVVILAVNGDHASPTPHGPQTGLGNLQVAPVQVEWTVITPAGGSVEHTHVHHGPQGVAQPQHRPQPGQASYPAESAAQSGESGVYRGNFTPPQVSGNYYLRAMAIVQGPDGQPLEVWSDEWMLDVQLRP
jgi:hypothetical protein